MKMNNVFSKKKTVIVLLLFIVMLLGIFCYFKFRTPLVFKSEIVKFEINDEFDGLDYIKEVRNGKLTDVKVNTDEIEFDKLGKYKIIYNYKGKKYELPIEIVDTKKPEFTINNLDLDLGMEVKASDMVSDIKDATKTKVKFKKEYDFNFEGDIEVIVQVIDEAGNISEKKGIVTLVKDVTAPTINGLNKLTVIKGNSVDFLQGVSVVDNRDPNPTLSYDSSNVNLNSVGEYEVEYVAKDRSGNEVKQKRIISVIENTSSSVTPNGEKIVYLTFDDGPSENTLKILDILDRYNIKATFFVTGTNQNYNYLITEAHNRGHTIGLHTYSHDYAKLYASPEAYFEDLTKVGNMVKDLIGYVPKYIRFPGGSSNTVSRKYCPGIMSYLSKEVVARGYQYYDWNGDSTDASGNNVAVSKLIANATSSKANQINILFHDTKAKSTTVEALPAIIENYLARGYRFAGIDDNSYVPHQGINN